MPQVKIIEPCLIDGAHYDRDEVVEVSDEMALILTSCARVREVVQSDLEVKLVERVKK